MNSLTTWLYLNILVVNHQESQSYWWGHKFAPGCCATLSPGSPLLLPMSFSSPFPCVPPCPLSKSTDLCSFTMSWIKQQAFSIPCGAGFWLDQFPAVLPSPSLCQILCKHNRRGATEEEWVAGRGLVCLKQTELRACPKFNSVSVSPKHPRGSWTLISIPYFLIRKKAAQPLTSGTHVYLPFMRTGNLPAFSSSHKYALELS